MQREGNEQDQARLQRLVSMRLSGATLEEVGRELGLTRQRAHQLLGAVIERLRDPQAEEWGKRFVGRPHRGGPEELCAKTVVRIARVDRQGLESLCEATGVPPAQVTRVAIRLLLREAVRQNLIPDYRQDRQANIREKA